MIRRLRLTLLTLTMALAASTPAAAGIADWLSWIEELSGPGPFHGYTVSVDRIVCWAEPAGGGGPLRRGSAFDRGGPLSCLAGHDTREDRMRAYLAVELGWYRSSRNVLAPQPDLDDAQVGLRRTNILFFGRVANGVEAGAGIGLNRFSGEGLRGEEFGFTRLSVPLRVRILPGMWIKRTTPLARVVQLNLGFDRLPSTFEAADFNQTGPFREEGESLASVYVGVDALAVLQALRHRD